MGSRRGTGRRSAIALLFWLTACGLDIPGETLGNPELQRDTWRSLELMDRAAAPECQTRQVIDTELVTPTVGARYVNGVLMEGRWVERWIVDRCGASVPYKVEFTADGKGGTFMKIGMPTDIETVDCLLPNGSKIVTTGAACQGARGMIAP